MSNNKVGIGSLKREKYFLNGNQTGPSITCRCEFSFDDSGLSFIRIQCNSRWSCSCLKFIRPTRVVAYILFGLVLLILWGYLDFYDFSLC